MAAKAKTIIVEPDSELDRLLKEANTGPVTVESDGTRYRIERIPTTGNLTFRTLDNLWDDYDPEAARAAILAAAGTMSDVDAEELKEYIYRRRAEGSRPREDE